MGNVRVIIRDPQSHPYVIIEPLLALKFVLLTDVLSIVLSLVWYAVQAWIGGLCTYVMLQAIWPSLEDRIPNNMPVSTGMTTAQFVAYIVFCVISLPIIWIRPHKLKMLCVKSTSLSACGSTVC